MDEGRGVAHTRRDSASSIVLPKAGQEGRGEQVGEVNPALVDGSPTCNMETLFADSSGCTPQATRDQAGLDEKALDELLDQELAAMDEVVELESLASSVDHMAESEGLNHATEDEQVNHFLQDAWKALEQGNAEGEVARRRFEQEFGELSSQISTKNAQSTETTNLPTNDEISSPTTHLQDGASNALLNHSERMCSLDEVAHVKSVLEEMVQTIIQAFVSQASTFDLSESNRAPNILCSTSVAKTESERIAKLAARQLEERQNALESQLKERQSQSEALRAQELEAAKKQQAEYEKGLELKRQEAAFQASHHAEQARIVQDQAAAEKAKQEEKWAHEVAKEEENKRKALRAQAAAKLQAEKKAHEKFLKSLADEMEEREKERARAAQELEEQRRQALARAEAEWRQKDASIRIQRLVRGWLGRRQLQCRSGAVQRIQRAMKAVADRLKGLKFRAQYKSTMLALKQARLGMENEDRLAFRIRELDRTNYLGMVVEDVLAHEIRAHERHIATQERKLMNIEDLASQQFRAAETQRVKKELYAMIQEDLLAQQVRAKYIAEREAAAQKIRERQLRRDAQTNVLQASLQGETLHIAKGNYEELNEGRCNEWSSFPTCIQVEENAFPTFSALAPAPCLGKSLRELTVRNNMITSLSGIEACQKLEVLDLGYNHLVMAAVECLRPLGQLVSLNLEGNPLGEVFVGSRFLGGSDSRLKSLILSNCCMNDLPRRLMAPDLQILKLDGNELSELALMHQDNSLPSLEKLVLSNNKIQKISTRCAHVIPSIKSLDLSYNQGLTLSLDALVEHINLESLNITPITLGQSQVQHLTKYLKGLQELNGDPNFAVKLCEREIILFQGVVRGAIKREKIRKAMETVAYCSDDESSEELESVDMAEFEYEMSDEDEKFIPKDDFTPSSEPAVQPDIDTVRPSAKEPQPLSQLNEFESSGFGALLSPQRRAELGEAAERLRKITHAAHGQPNHISTPSQTSGSTLLENGVPRLQVAPESTVRQEDSMPQLTQFPGKVVSQNAEFAIAAARLRRITQESMSPVRAKPNQEQGQQGFDSTTSRTEFQLAAARLNSLSLQQDNNVQAGSNSFPDTASYGDRNAQVQRILQATLESSVTKTRDSKHEVPESTGEQCCTDGRTPIPPITARSAFSSSSSSAGQSSKSSKRSSRVSARHRLHPSNAKHTNPQPKPTPNVMICTNRADRQHHLLKRKRQPSKVPAWARKPPVVE